MSPSPDQPHLNGAFYGPPIHHNTKSSHRPRSRGGSTCNPLTCCFSCICSCIFNLIFQILITVAIFIGILTLIFWFIFRPNVPKFHVDDVSLTQFSIADSNNTLYYNLAVNMTFRNPNRRLGIYYDKVEANAMYYDQRLASTEIQGFYLGHKKEDNNVSTVFRGEQLVVLKSNEKSRYESESKESVYKIDLKLRLKIRFKVWWMKTPKFKRKVEYCDRDIKVPLIITSSWNRKIDTCRFDWYTFGRVILIIMFCIAFVYVLSI